MPDTKTKPKKETKDTLAQKYTPMSYGEWLSRNHPDASKKIREAASKKTIPGQPGAQKFSTPDITMMEDQPVNAWVREAYGGGGATHLQAQYKSYANELSMKMAKEVWDLQADGKLNNDEAKELRAKTKNPAFYDQTIAQIDRMQPRNATGMVKTKDLKTQPGTGAGAKPAPGSFGEGLQKVLGGGDAKTSSVDYAGMSELINQGGALGDVLSSASFGLDVSKPNPKLRVQIGGPVGTTDKMATAQAKSEAEYQAQLKSMGQRDAQGKKLKKPTGEPTGGRQYGGFGLGNLLGKSAEQTRAQVSGAFQPGTNNKQYYESINYLKTLDAATLTRLQQQLVLAGYYNTDVIKHQGVMWGYAGDMPTIKAWNDLHQDMLGQGQSMVETIKARQNAYAPSLAAMLTGADTEGGLTGAGQPAPMELTLSDPDTVKSAAQQFFVSSLGRLPTEGEQNALIASIHKSERAQGQQKLAAITATAQRNQANALAAAGYGVPLDANGLTAAQNELDGLLKGGGTIMFPVAGKATYGNDWAQARSGGRSHQGTDIFAPLGTPVVAAVGGTVTKIGKGGIQGKMLSISIRGADGKNYFYNHLGDLPNVKVGQTVQRGAQIGQVGDAQHRIGTGNHLHFSINESTARAENPFKYLQAAQQGGVQPTAAMPIGPGGGAVAAFMEAVKAHESGGNYTIHTKGKGSASGAYQVTDQTWHHFGGYATAASAPKEVQDAFARQKIQGMISSGVSSPREWAAVWYLGHVPKTAEEWNRVPAPGAGNRITPTQYADWIEQRMGPAAGKQTPITPEMYETEAVDVGASVEQFTKEQRPAEYGAQKLGKAYDTLTQMLSGQGG